jgi:hypothetical protein
MINQFQVNNKNNTAEIRKNNKEDAKMLNLEKVYTVKGSATRALNKAFRNGALNATDYIVSEVDGGFKIVLIQHEIGPIEFCDAELETRWHELVCQILPNAECNEETLGFDWFIFGAEKTFTEIYAWFDSEYSEGLEALKCKQNYFKLPSDERAEKRNRLTEQQKSALDALAGVKTLAKMSDDERAEVWFPFKEIYSSTIPTTVEKRSMGGIMGGLINRGFIRFVANGKEFIGKKAVAVCITDAGLAATARTYCEIQAEIKDLQVA